MPSLSRANANTFSDSFAGRDQLSDRPADMGICQPNMTRAPRITLEIGKYAAIFNLPGAPSVTSTVTRYYVH